MYQRVWDCGEYISRCEEIHLLFVSQVVVLFWSHSTVWPMRSVFEKQWENDNNKNKVDKMRPAEKIDGRENVGSDFALPHLLLSPSSLSPPPSHLLIHSISLSSLLLLLSISLYFSLRLYLSHSSSIYLPFACLFYSVHRAHNRIKLYFRTLECQIHKISHKTNSTESQFFKIEQEKEKNVKKKIKLDINWALTNNVNHIFSPFL